MPVVCPLHGALIVYKPPLTTNHFLPQSVPPPACGLAGSLEMNTNSRHGCSSRCSWCRTTAAAAPSTPPRDEEVSRRYPVVCTTRSKLLSLSRVSPGMWCSSLPPRRSICRLLFAISGELQQQHVERQLPDSASGRRTCLADDAPTPRVFLLGEHHSLPHNFPRALGWVKVLPDRTVISSQAQGTASDGQPFTSPRLKAEDTSPERFTHGAAPSRWGWVSRVTRRARLLGPRETAVGGTPAVDQRWERGEV